MQDGATSHTTNLNINFLNDKFQERMVFLLIAVRTQMAALQTKYELSFHSFVWGFVQDQFCRIEHESIPELQQAVQDVVDDYPDRNAVGRSSEFVQACPGVLGGVWRLFEALSQTYLKNADSKLFSSIFEFVIQ